MTMDTRDENARLMDGDELEDDSPPIEREPVRWMGYAQGRGFFEIARQELETISE